MIAERGRPGQSRQLPAAYGELAESSSWPAIRSSCS